MSADNFVLAEGNAESFNRPIGPGDTAGNNEAGVVAEEKTSAMGGDGGIDESDDESIKLDEETFRAFQSAYAEAEQNAAQEQARAGTNCCTTCFQLVLLCLTVAKLERCYENDDPDDAGFNTFWILSPLLLIFGCIFCTCACLIYGADGDLTAEMMDEDDKDGDADEENPSPPVIPLVVPPPAAASDPTANVTDPPETLDTPKTDGHIDNQPDHPGLSGVGAPNVDMDDLD